MVDIYDKMVKEAIAAQKADVSTVSKNRGKKFKIEDTKAYVDVANQMQAVEGQSEAVFRLHIDSINSHYEILNSLTDTVRPEDDPFVEHYQTPAILEILYEEDEDFKKSMDKFIDAIGKSEAMIGKEVIRRYGGFYGPTCVVDFALVPGSTSNIVNQILIGTDIPTKHKQAILAAKSWGMNTSYGIGGVFTEEIEKGTSAADAVKMEIEMFKKIYATPITAQAELMDSMDHQSFDVRKYMSQYKDRMRDTVINAMNEGVHYGNIETVPAYCVGDIAHHISQSTYNMCKDDVVMAVIEATTGVMEATLKKASGKFKSPYEPLTLATGATASAVEYILEMDGFNAQMISDLFSQRFHNYVPMYPTRSGAAELHNCDFVDMITRGYTHVVRARRSQGNTKNMIVPEVSGFLVDLNPIHQNEVIMNPQRYTYPGCAISVHFSALMRLADYPCLLTSEPVTATMMTNIIALNPESPASPARTCKTCGMAAEGRHQYCEYLEAV